MSLLLLVIHRINNLSIPKGGTYIHDAFQILSAYNEFFTFRATFRRKDGIWSFLHGDPPALWMKSIPFDQIKIELLKRGYSYEWSRELDPDGATVGSTDTAIAGSAHPK